MYSRKIVGWEVHGTDDSDHAVRLVRRTALAEGIAMMATKPVLHGDNGSTLKATTVLAMLNWLGVKPSYSRPRVSDDNAYAESLFRKRPAKSGLTRSSGLVTQPAGTHRCGSRSSIWRAGCVGRRASTSFM